MSMRVGKMEGERKRRTQKEGIEGRDRRRERKNIERQRGIKRWRRTESVREKKERKKE